MGLELISHDFTPSPLAEQVSIDAQDLTGSDLMAQKDSQWALIA